MMWFLRNLFTLCFLFSSVFSLSPSTSFTSETCKMDVECGGRAYSEQDLDKAATAACSQFMVTRNSCTGFSCYYLKKAIPMVPTVSYYNGPDFPENGLILKWALPTRRVIERATSYVIVQLHLTGYGPGGVPRRTCRAIGAIERKERNNFVKCKINKHQNVPREPRVKPPKSHTEIEEVEDDEDEEDDNIISF